MESLDLIQLRISKIDLYLGSLSVGSMSINLKKSNDKSELTYSKLIKILKKYALIPRQQRHLTKRIRVIVEYTQIFVKTNSKLTNFKY